MNENFSKHIKDVLSNSKNEAIRLGHNYIGTEHIMLSILKKCDDKIMSVLDSLNIDSDDIISQIESMSSEVSVINNKAINKLNLNKEAERALKTTFLEAKLLKSANVDLIHLFLCILRNENDPLTKLMNNNDIDYNTIKEEFLFQFKGNNDDYSVIEYNDKLYDNPYYNSSNTNYSKNKTKTPILDNFSNDLTSLATNGLLDSVIGRDFEINRVAQILCRRKKNNILLIGEPGVGKTSIAEGLAINIINNYVPKSLLGKRVLSLDIAALVAGTKYRGQFEERIKAIIDELNNNRDVIIFIDEFHTILGAGSSVGSLDISNIIKPSLARGEIQCIGATTLSEYRQYIEKDGALVRRFQNILVNQTSAEQTLEILYDLKTKYEQYHNVVYSDESLLHTIYMANKYIMNKSFPDKAIDIIDEAGALLNNKSIIYFDKLKKLNNKLAQIKNNKNEVILNKKNINIDNLRNQENDIVNQINTITKEHQLKEKTKNIVTNDIINTVVSMISNVPITNQYKKESKYLFENLNKIKKEIIGQDDSIEKVIKVLKRRIIGLKDIEKPIGSFIFLGSTGIGKTSLAKLIAKYLFGDENKLIRIDMSEYMEKFSVSRLIGSPPGYIGYEQGGQLTEAVRNNPYSVVLLDEIEKAHSDIFNLLLQILDNGYLTDSLSRKIDFRNTVIILTSNIGNKKYIEFGNGLGYTTKSKLQHEKSIFDEIIFKELKNKFSPEILNRFDEIILFRLLNKVDMAKILNIELNNLKNKLQNMGYLIKISTKCKDNILLEGYNNNYGVRHLKNIIRNRLEDLISDFILKNNTKNKNVINIDYKDKKYIIY